MTRWESLLIRLGLKKPPPGVLEPEPTAPLPPPQPVADEQPLPPLPGVKGKKHGRPRD